MNNQKILGELEIDYNRGVIYFTPSEGVTAGATLLRVSRIQPQQLSDSLIDITSQSPTLRDELLLAITQNSTV